MLTETRQLKERRFETDTGKPHRQALGGLGSAALGAATYATVHTD
jgi:hypothetical protein